VRRSVYFLALPFFFTLFFSKNRPSKTTIIACVPTAKTFDGYTFINPKIVESGSDFAPFFLQFGDSYEKIRQTDIQKAENLREWRERFCKNSDEKDIEEVVYQSSEDDLYVLLGAVESEGDKNPLGALSGNQFAEVLRYNHCSEAVKYLIFTRKCEKHVTQNGDAWTPASRDLEAMQQLITDGLDEFSAIKSHFIRLRYAYQIVRLAHYRGDFPQTIRLFNYLMPQIDRRRASIVYWWTLGHQAGALLKLKKYPEAAYRFALIFQNCPSKRAQAYRSFYIPNDDIWQKTLNFCEKDQERAACYSLRAGAAHATVGDLEQLYALDPQAPVLEMMLVSEVQQLEKIFLTTPISVQKYGRPATILRRDKASEHLFSLKKLVEKVWREKKCHNPKLWRAVDGYLELLAGDFYAAEKEMDAAASQLSGASEDESLREQLDIWRLLLDICKIDPADPNSVDRAFAIKSFGAFKKQPDFEPFLKDWLSNRYAQTNQPGKATLEAWGWKGLRANPTLAEIDNLIRAASDGELSRMEDALLTDSSGNILLGSFYEMRATYLLAENHPEAALDALRKIPEVERATAQKFMAFKERINDCVHCPMSDSVLLDRRALVEKLVELDFQARANLAEGAPQYYRLGLAYYNMSFFGPAWSAMDNFRSGSSWNTLNRRADGVFSSSIGPHGNRENLSCEIALGYFRQAMSLSRDPELSARAAFMASKCQLNAWYCSKSANYKIGSRQIPEVPADFRLYFDILKKNYAKTAFYKQAMSECKWFRAYAAR
jgi:hypothetical protein